MIQVIYNANPNAPIGKNHIDALHRCREVQTKEFNTTDEARNFWFECSSPITSLDELMPKSDFPILDEKYLNIDSIIIKNEDSVLTEE